jgi:hypothetical protein
MTVTRTETSVADAIARPSHRTVRLLGTAAGPVFAVAIVSQAFTRDGFNLADHPFSLLALGSGGWMQTLAFLVVGAAFTFAGYGARRMGTSLTTGTSRLVTVFGVATITAGLFPTDPWHGFPAGAVEETTWHGIVHSGAAGVGGLALVAAAFLAARYHHRHGQVGPRNLAVAAAFTSLALGSAGSASGDFRLAFVGGATAWLWTSLEIGRATTYDNMQPRR